MVISTGGMLDHIVTGGQNYVVFSFSQKQDGKNPITLKNEAGEAILDHVPENDFTIMVFTSPDLVEGTYTLWSNDIQQAGIAGGVEGFGGGPGGPGGSGGGEPPTGEGQQPPEGGFEGGEPGGGEPPAGEGQQPPEGGFEGGAPDSSGGGFPAGNTGTSQEKTTEFVILGNENSYSQVGPAA